MKEKSFDIVFLRLVIFQLALAYLTLTMLMFYNLCFNADGFWEYLCVSLLTLVFGFMAWVFFRDALSQDKEKVTSTLKSWGGGSDLFGFLLFVIVFLLFGFVALVLTSLYRLFFDRNKGL